MNETPSQKFNLVVYYNKGKHLSSRFKTKPKFYENVYIYSDEDYLYAYDSSKFGKEEDCIVAMMRKTIDFSFKYNGIHVSGLEHSDNMTKGETLLYQKWLITNLSREELEKEHWYNF